MGALALIATAPLLWAKTEAHHDRPAAPIHAAASASPPAAPAATAPAATADPKNIPDYGGRDSAAAASFEGAAGADAPNPLSQAWRAFEALVIVLALIFGGLYLLKHYGVLEGGAFTGKGGPGAAALRRMARQRIRNSRGSSSTSTPILGDGAIQLLGTQPLPGNPGACVHLLSIENRTFLIGATAQSVTLMSEWEETTDDGDADVTPGAFNEYLKRQGAVAPTPIEEDVVETSVSDANDRLREMLSRVRDEQLETSAGKTEL